MKITILSIQNEKQVCIEEKKKLFSPHSKCECLKTVLCRHIILWIHFKDVMDDVRPLREFSLCVFSFILGGGQSESIKYCGGGVFLIQIKKYGLTFFVCFSA